MIPNLKKPIRKRDEAYLKWIRTQPCLTLCVNGGIEAHHVAPIGGGKVGSKTDDSRAVPICTFLHRYYHDNGRKAFEANTGLDLEAEIKKLNAKYLQEHPLPKRERKPKVRTYQKRIINRGWAVLSPHLNFPVVETIEEARALRLKLGKGRIARCQVRPEGQR